MRARNLISFGMAAAIAAACSNPSGESASDPSADLLSELEPALLLPASGSGTAVLSAAELTPAEEGPTSAAPAPRPRDTPARVEHTAHVDDLQPEIVRAVVNVPSDEVVVASAAATSAGDEHAGHDHDDHPAPARGIVIRGGVDVGIFGDPCIPGGHRPGNGAVAGRGEGILGGIADATSLGAMGTMINDQTPRIGQGSLPYPRNQRGSATRGGGAPGGMGGGGRMFIR
jgi:hypothetical protein